MSGFNYPQQWVAAGIVGLGMMLGGCGSSSSDSGSPLAGDDDSGTGQVAVTNITGSVAVGAPVSGATIDVQCDSGAAVASVTSNSNGGYSLMVPQSNFPCVFRASGGDLPTDISALYSYLAEAGSSTANLNITPLTDMALAYALLEATGQSSADWFADTSNWNGVSGGLNDAISTLRSALSGAGFELPAGWSDSNLLAPFSEVFTPSNTPATGTLDALLESIRAALGAAGDSGVTGYDALLASLMSGGQFPPFIDPSDNGENGGGDTGDNGSGDGDTTVYDAVAPANLGGEPGPTVTDYLATISYSWPVAIYDVPEGNESWYGEGAITFGGTTDNWTMTLTGADGSVISNLNASGSFTSALTPYSQVDYGVMVVNTPGQVFINKGTAIDEHMSVFIYHDSGLISGFAGGQSDVKFRNSLVHYGNGVPALFADIAGTWTSTVNVFCSGPYGPATEVTNSAVITSGGSVTLDGTSQLCGSSLPQQLQWGGKNDFVTASTTTDGGYLVELDVLNMEAANSGKVRIELASDYSMIGISAYLPEWLEFRNPVRQ